MLACLFLSIQPIFFNQYTNGIPTTEYKIFVFDQNLRTDFLFVLVIYYILCQLIKIDRKITTQTGLIKSKIDHRNCTFKYILPKNS